MLRIDSSLNVNLLNLGHVPVSIQKLYKTVSEQLSGQRAEATKKTIRYGSDIYDIHTHSCNFIHMPFMTLL